MTMVTVFQTPIYHVMQQQSNGYTSLLQLCLVMWYTPLLQLCAWSCGTHHCYNCAWSCGTHNCYNCVLGHVLHIIVITVCLVMWYTS